MNDVLLQMSEDLDLDLSFLDTTDPKTSSGDYSINCFVERLFRVRLIACNNDDPDISIFEVEGDDGVEKCISRYFQDASTITQLIVPNGKTYASDYNLVTHFRIVCSEYHSKSPTNYKLEMFLRASGITGVSPRCKAAMIIGLMGSSGGNHVNVPTQYETLSLYDLSMYSPIDVYSSDVKPTLNNLCDVSGMAVPYYVPINCQWHILKYCRHPCAQLIHDEMMWINLYWDQHFGSIFSTQGDYSNL